MANLRPDEDNGYDGIKWTLVIALLAAGIYANYHFAEIAWSLRLTAWILLTLILAAIALQTAKGQQTLEFAKEARIELRKVVWPTREETTQATIIVMIMVMIMAVFLWGVDSLLFWIVAKFTG